MGRRVPTWGPVRGEACLATTLPLNYSWRLFAAHARDRQPPVREDAAEQAGERHRRRLAGDDRFPAQLQFGRRALAERRRKRATHDLVNRGLVAEPHLRLGRVHVDVDHVGRHLEEQVDLGAALLDRRDAVSVDDRVRDRLVLDDPAVDEDVLRASPRPLLRQRGHEAVHAELQPLPSRPPPGRPAPRTAGRSARAASSRAGTWMTVRPALASVKPTPGYARASWVTIRETCADSAASDLRNFRRAGRL